jgi:hypothetical protein
MTEPEPPPGTDSPELDELERLAALMDSAVRIPVIGWRIGLDGLIGLVPGVGDAASLIPAGYILYKARRFDIPSSLFARMLLNVAADATLGVVPLIGDIFDFAFKSNRRNVALLRRHLERREAVLARAAARSPD